MEEIKENLPPVKRHWLLYYTGIVFLLFTVYIVGLIPLYLRVVSDVILDDTPLGYLCILLYKAVDVITLTGTWILLFRLRPLVGRRACIVLCAVYFGLLFYQNFGNVAYSWLTVGGDSEEFGSDLLGALYPVLLGILQTGSVFAVCEITFTRYFAVCAVRQKALLSLGREAEIPTAGLQPIPKKPTGGNVYATLLTVSGSILLGVRLLSRILYDITMGAPLDTAELLLMIGAYLLDILVVTAYLLIAYRILSKPFTR